MALEIGQDPEIVIAATHGRRGIDNLRELKPWISEDKINEEVQSFERSILAFADEYSLKMAKKNAVQAEIGSEYTASSNNSSRRGSGQDSITSTTASDDSRRSSLFDVEKPLSVSTAYATAQMMNTTEEELEAGMNKLELIKAELEQVKEAEETLVDKSVRILPGVRKMIDSLPEGRYAVATSGATTYCHGCLTRVG